MDLKIALLDLMNKKKILIIDMGLGNLGSVTSSIDRLGYESVKLKYPPQKEDSETYTHAILPGVGSFCKGMESLKSSGFADWIINDWSYAEKPLLGICLGMQLLASSGDEGSKSNKIVKGLNLIPGEIKKIQVSQNLLLPHVGWNEVCWENLEDIIVKDVPQKGDFYFVHSYVFLPDKKENSLAKTIYGECFTSVVKDRKCIGVQFHPEKSQKIGNILLKNFLDL